MRSELATVALLIFGACTEATSPGSDAGSDAIADVGPPEVGPIDGGTQPRDADPEDADAPEVGPIDSGTSTTTCGRTAFTSTLECSVCQVDRCCAVAQNCAANTECDVVYECQRACTNAACRRACQVDHPDGIWDFSGLYICLQNGCATQCGFPAVTCGGISLTTTTCNACFRSKCCAAGEACGANDQCLALIYQCLDKRGCPDSDGPCAQRCRGLYPVGAPIFDEALTCARTECPTECAGL